MSANRYLYLIRHGQYRYTNDGDDILTDTGEDQARLTARALLTTRVSTIYHSSMYRAEQTARIIGQVFPEAPLQPSDLLRECIPSVPSRLAAVYAVTQDRSIPTEKETMNCARRLDKAYDAFFTAPEGEGNVHELLVCHGNIIRYLVARVIEADPAIWVNMAVHNCGITTVYINAYHQATLITHNEVGHLPDALRTHG